MPHTRGRGNAGVYEYRAKIWWANRRALMDFRRVPAAISDSAGGAWPLGRQPIGDSQSNDLPLEPASVVDPVFTPFCHLGGDHSLTLFT
jgi:hypothetical protein